MMTERNDIETADDSTTPFLVINRNETISVMLAEDIDIYYDWARKYFYIMKVIYNIKLMVNTPKIGVRTVQQYLNRG